MPLGHSRNGPMGNKRTTEQKVRLVKTFSADVITVRQLGLPPAKSRERRAQIGSRFMGRYFLIHCYCRWENILNVSAIRRTVSLYLNTKVDFFKINQRSNALNYVILPISFNYIFCIGSVNNRTTDKLLKIKRSVCRAGPFWPAAEYLLEKTGLLCSKAKEEWLFILPLSSSKHLKMGIDWA